MAKSLKQQLMERPDAREKEITIEAYGGEPFRCSVRRLTIAERDQLMKDYELGQADSERAKQATVAIVALALVPGDGEQTYTVEEVRAMPAAIVDAVAAEVMAFNGWTKAGKAALDDQFRAPA